MIRKYLDKVPLVILVGITLLVMLGMLYFGVRLKGYRLANNVKWLPPGQGLAFDRFSIAYTDDFFPMDSSGANPGANQGLTIEMVLHCANVVRPAFRYVLSVSDGDDRRQLLIGQWLNWLIAMNGDDHEGSRGVARLSADMSKTDSHQIFLTIISGQQGSSIYLNGVRFNDHARLQLYFPHRQGHKTHLILGSSLHGGKPWHGDISMLAIYDVALSDADVTDHYHQWAAGRHLEEDGGPALRMYYRFDPTQTGTVRNLAADEYHLNIPVFMTILKKKFLAWPNVNQDGRRLTRDMLVNLVGFMPLGFLLCLVLDRLEGLSGRYKGLLAVGIAFAFSLSLEVVQAWIPPRDSSVLDLILNTAGAAVSVIVAHLLIFRHSHVT